MKIGQNKEMRLRSNMSDKNKIVIKIGSSSLTYESGRLNFRKVEKMAKVLSNLQNSGKQVTLVSSGAIAVGAGKLGWKRKPESIAEKQALAAVGQSILMKIYQRFFNEYNQTTAQVLLTKGVMLDPVRKQNAKNTLTHLLDMNIIPIINENDTVSTEQIEFGDNDTLSAYVATLIKADLLIILSDIDGLYNADPRKNPNATVISNVSDISNKIQELAGDSESSFGTGGMVTKLTAAKLCVKEGIDTIITNGKNPETLFDIFEGKKIGTLFIGKNTTLNKSQKKNF